MKCGPVLLVVFLSLATASLSIAADWPQWRGPEANGVVVGGAKLVDSLPAEGPPKLWQSERLPGGTGGGWSGVSVVGGRAYVYLNWKGTEPVATRKLTGRGLQGLGWRQDVPPELLATVEKARLSEERAAIKNSREVRKWAGEWTKANVPPEQRKWQSWASIRLNWGARGIPMDVLEKLVPIKDKEFASQEELDKWFAENGIEGNIKKYVAGVIRTTRKVADDVMLCLDAATGKTLWKTTLPGRSTGFPSSSTPCIEGNRGYVLGSDANIYCFDTSDGKKVWQAKGKGNARSFDAASFIMADGVLVLIAGPVTGYDPKSGEELWSSRKITGDHQSAAYWRHGGKTYLICNSKRDVACVEPASGEVLWTTPGGGWSSVAVDGDRMAVYTSKKQVGLSTYKLSLTGAERIGGVPFTDRGASPVIHDGHAYAVGGRGNAWAKCISLETGELKWEEKLRGNAEISSPIVADGKVIAVVGTVLQMFKASPAGYASLGTAKLGVESCTSPSLVDGKLFLRLRQGVACYDLTAK